MKVRLYRRPRPVLIHWDDSEVMLNAAWNDTATLKEWAGKQHSFTSCGLLVGETKRAYLLAGGHAPGTMAPYSGLTSIPKGAVRKIRRLKL